MQDLADDRDIFSAWIPSRHSCKEDSLKALSWIFTKWNFKPNQNTFGLCRNVSLVLSTRRVRKVKIHHV